MQDIFLKVAAHHEAKWKLADEQDAWADDMAKKMRNLIRHAEQALHKTHGSILCVSFSVEQSDRALGRRSGISRN